MLIYLCLPLSNYWVYLYGAPVSTTECSSINTIHCYILKRHLKDSENLRSVSKGKNRKQNLDRIICQN